MDEKAKVDFYVVEAIVDRFERLVKLVVIIFVSAFLISQAIWTYAALQYDYGSSEVTVDGKDGNANYIGNDGDIVNGEDSSEAQMETEEERQEQRNESAEE